MKLLIRVLLIISAVILSAALVRTWVDHRSKASTTAEPWRNDPIISTAKDREKNADKPWLNDPIVDEKK
jgi:hypothetical protein